VFIYGRPIRLPANLKVYLGTWSNPARLKAIAAWLSVLVEVTDVCLEQKLD